MTHITSSAPGRVCLFGEDVDYMGLEVITIAINQRITVKGKINSSGKITVDLRDFDRSFQFKNEKQKLKEKRDYVKSAFNLYHELLPSDFGAKIIITSNLSIGKGLSSSSALCSALIGFFDKAAGIESEPQKLAWKAYLAEVVNLGEPGGMMDHFASVIGNVIHLECREPFKVDELGIKLDGLVIGDTQKQKETIQTITKRKQEINSGIEHMNKIDPLFNLQNYVFSKVENEFESNYNIGLKRLLGILGIRDIVRQGYKMMKKEERNEKLLIELINKHHHYQEKYFENVTTRMQELINIAKIAGAKACKLLGSGNGGSFLAYSPGKEDVVAAALEDASGSAYILKQDKGLEVITSE